MPKLETERPKRYVVLLNCGGYEQTKKLLKLLLKRYELPHALEEFENPLAIAADRNKNLLEGVKRHTKPAKEHAKLRVRNQQPQYHRGLNTKRPQEIIKTRNPRNRTRTTRQQQFDRTDRRRTPKCAREGSQTPSNREKPCRHGEKSTI